METIVFALFILFMAGAAAYAVHMGIWASRKAEPDPIALIHETRATRREINERAMKEWEAEWKVYFPDPPPLENKEELYDSYIDRVMGETRTLVNKNILPIPTRTQTYRSPYGAYYDNPNDFLYDMYRENANPPMYQRHLDAGTLSIQELERVRMENERSASEFYQRYMMETAKNYYAWGGPPQQMPPRPENEQWGLPSPSTTPTLMPPHGSINLGRNTRPTRFPLG